jgi:hypothetical protein
MTEDENILAMLGEMIAQVTRQHGIAVGDDGRLLDAVTQIHPHDRRAAGDDLTRALGRQGLSIRPNLTIDGSLSARMYGPLGDLFDPGLSTARLRTAATELNRLVNELYEREAAAAPLHSGVPDDDQGDDRPADGWRLNYEGPRG